MSIATLPLINKRSLNASLQLYMSVKNLIPTNETIYSDQFWVNWAESYDKIETRKSIKQMSGW